MFLLDGSGAILTAVLLSQLLPRLRNLFAMPLSVLYTLSGLAALFALYSLLCAGRPSLHRAPYLRGIALANLLYCGLTSGLLLYFREQLTLYDLLYFTGEILVILVLVYIEFRFTQKASV